MFLLGLESNLIQNLEISLDSLRSLTSDHLAVVSDAAMVEFNNEIEATTPQSFFSLRCFLSPTGVTILIFMPSGIGIIAGVFHRQR